VKNDNEIIIMKWNNENNEMKWRNNNVCSNNNNEIMIM